MTIMSYFRVIQPPEFNYMTVQPALLLTVPQGSIVQPASSVQAAVTEDTVLLSGNLSHSEVIFKNLSSSVWL